MQYAVGVRILRYDGAGREHLGGADAVHYDAHLLLLVVDRVLQPFLVYHPVGLARHTTIDIVVLSYRALEVRTGLSYVYLLIEVFEVRYEEVQFYHFLKVRIQIACK